MYWEYSAVALVLAGTLACGACSPSTPAARPIETAAPAPAPGTVQATVLVGACGEAACEGTVLGAVVMGSAAPVVNDGEAIRFAVPAATRALRQGDAPAFRDGAALRLTLAHTPPMREGDGAPPPAWTVVGVATPGLR